MRDLATAEPGYDFAHGKLRALVYESIGLARRRLLHRRVAEALLRTATGAETASLLALHLGRAGDDAGSAEQHRLAAEHAASVLAHGDALEHLDAALALGHPDRVGLLRAHRRPAHARRRLCRRVVELRDRRGRMRTLWRWRDSSRSSRRVHHRRGEWDRAEARFTVALESVSAQDEGLRARILADLSLTLHHAGAPQRATTIAEQARALAESAADDHAQAQAHNLLGVLAREAGHLDRAARELERSLALAERLDEPSGRVAALNNLALVARDAGEPVVALELTQEALTLCVAQGDRHREAALENNLADLHHAAGRSDESMAHLKRAVAIFSDVGADEATRLPEIWKLASW